MGGMHGFGPVVVPESEAPYHERWEPRVFALWVASEAEGLAAGSGRRVRELMPPEEYLRASYYERWQWSNERRLIAKGTIAEREIDDWVERLARHQEAPVRNDPVQRSRILDVVRTHSEELEPIADPALQMGTRVRVQRMRPSGHTRCPRYVRGARGVIEAVRGTYPFPDEGPSRGARATVYAVSFDSAELFGRADEGSDWTVVLDLYEPYLEPA